LDELEEGDRVGASTAGRRAQMLAYREDLKAVPVRGNLDTHLQQLEAGEFEGLVMAATDAERLGRGGRGRAAFATGVCSADPREGAMALEGRAERKDVLQALKCLDDTDSHRAVVAERAWLHELGEHDDLPAGALANVQEGQMVMEAVVVSGDGLEIVRDEAEGA